MEQGVPPDNPTEWISIQVWCGHLGWGYGWNRFNTSDCPGGCQEYEVNNVRKTACYGINQTLPDEPVDVGEAPESVKKVQEKLALMFPGEGDRATFIIVIGLIISSILVVLTRVWQVFPITFLGIFLMGLTWGWLPAWVAVIFVAGVGFLIVKSLWGLGGE
jgi:hypothetical protein